MINFEPKQIANFLSECLILGIQNNDDVVLLEVNDKIKNGQTIN